jgi:hypothetical protein
MSFDPTRAPRTQGYLWDLAKALHAGRSWNEIARALGHPPRAYRTHYRPLVRAYCLRLLPDPDGHGTLIRYHQQGGCHPDGRRCEPCTAANAENLRRNNNRAPVRTDPAFLRQLARRLVDGDSWDQIAEDLGRSRVRLQEQVRDLVQPYCLEILDVEQPSTTHRAHGTYVKFVVDRCKCEPCRYANREYERQRGLKLRRGLVPYVDANPVRRHLRLLADHGIGLKQVARLTGVPHGSLTKLLYGDPQRGLAPSKRVRAATAKRIIKLRPKADALAGGARVDGTATRALIRHLQQLGATNTWIATQLAGKPTRSLQLGTRDTVTAATARAVRELHDRVIAGDLIPEGRHSRWEQERAA